MGREKAAVGKKRKKSSHLGEKCCIISVVCIEFQVSLV